MSKTFPSTCLSLCTLLLLASAIAFSMPVAAQDSPFTDLLRMPAGRPSRGDEIRYEATIVPAEAQQGDVVTLKLTATLAPGWYTYSQRAISGSSPTEIKISRTGGLQPLEASFAAGRSPKVVQEKFGEQVFVYEKYFGRVTFSRRFRIADDVPPGHATVTGTISYQVCSSGSGGTCIPGEAEFTAAVNVLAQSSQQIVRAKPSPMRTTLKIKAATWKVSLSPRQAKPGDTVTISVQAELQEPWHIYSLNQQRTPEGLGPLPTAIKLEELENLTLVDRAFSGPQAKVSEEPVIYPDLSILTHEGRVVWTRQIKVPDDAQPGDVLLSGRVGYMICTDRKCDSPTGFSFSGTLTVANSANEESSLFALSAPFSTAQASEFVEMVVAERPAAESTDEQYAESASPNHGAANRALIPFLILAVTAGFAALLTPCVFPMIPITVSFFLKQSEKQHHKPISMALIYCAGIVATFTMLGIIISVIFGATALMQLGNNPWANLAIAGVLVFFGANLLGLFEIRIPSWLLTLSSGQESRGGIVGVLFMAITFTLTSFTCTFAFVGPLLVQATQGQVYWPVIGLMAFSAAFALPFFFLALFPSFLQRLPKSGGWMNNVKVVMGLLEVGAAFKFLSVADVAWFGMPWVFDYHLVMSAWMITAVTTSVYLLGLFRLPHDTPSDRIGVVQLALAMIFLGLGSYLAVGLFGNEEPKGAVWSNIAAFAPPRVQVNEDASGPFTEHDGLKYALDFEQAVETARASGKPLFLDFTGMNCINCRKMEATVMTKPHIREKLQQLVRVQLYTDVLPNIRDKSQAKRIIENNRNLQVKWFGDVTLPAYAIITPGRRILSKIEGFNSDEAFAKFLDRGLQNWQLAKRNELASRLVQRP